MEVECDEVDGLTSLEDEGGVRVVTSALTQQTRRPQPGG